MTTGSSALGELFEALLDDLRRNLPVGAISRRFHNGLVEGFVQLATLLQKKTALNRVCLSGGTFHNIYLSERLEARLYEAGFEVFTQKEVPSGDGGLSLGQALVAAAKLHAPRSSNAWLTQPVAERCCCRFAKIS